MRNRYSPYSRVEPTAVRASDSYLSQLRYESVSEIVKVLFYLYMQLNLMFVFVFGKKWHSTIDINISPSYECFQTNGA